MSGCPPGWRTQIGVDPVLLRAICEAATSADAPGPDVPRIEMHWNNGFTGDYVGWGCGHFYQWRDCLAWFCTPHDHDEQWCPACLVGELTRGEVALTNPDSLSDHPLTDEAGR